MFDVIMSSYISLPRCSHINAMCYVRSRKILSLESITEPKGLTSYVLNLFTLTLHERVIFWH
jgi:hypothetical protein